MFSSVFRMLSLIYIIGRWHCKHKLIIDLLYATCNASAIPSCRLGLEQFGLAGVLGLGQHHHGLRCPDRDRFLERGLEVVCRTFRLGHIEMESRYSGNSSHLDSARPPVVVRILGREAGRGQKGVPLKVGDGRSEGPESSSCYRCGAALPQGSSLRGGRVHASKRK